MIQSDPYIPQSRPAAIVCGRGWWRTGLISHALPLMLFHQPTIQSFKLVLIVEV